MRPRWTVISAMTVLVIAFFTASAFGQAVNGTILGTVTDASGASVANAKVTVSETNTGTSRVVGSNESGNFIFPDLQPGTYSVTVEMTGFKKVIRPGILLEVN